MNPGHSAPDPYQIEPDRKSLVDRINDGVVIAGMVAVGAIVLAFAYALFFLSN